MCIIRNLQVTIKVLQRTFLLLTLKAYLGRKAIKIHFFNLLSFLDYEWFSLEWWYWIHFIFSENNKTKEVHHRLHLLRDILNDNKEIITRPTIALIPSIFALFSLPLFILSFSLSCQNLESNPMRYPMIAFYVISFIPQIITFLLYVYPSSLYFNEWHLTKIGQWITNHR
jgi:hypothetical protein